MYQKFKWNDLLDSEIIFTLFDDRIKVKKSSFKLFYTNFCILKIGEKYYIPLRLIRKELISLKVIYEEI